jgi:hypothetical protein
MNHFQGLSVDVKTVVKLILNKRAAVLTPRLSDVFVLLAYVIIRNMPNVSLMMMGTTSLASENTFC